MYSEVPDVEGQAPEATQAKRFAKRTGAVAAAGLLVAAFAFAGLNGGAAGATALFAKVAPTTLGGALAAKAKGTDGGMSTIGAAEVAICTDETADETSTCWEDYGGVCMYEKKSCNEYGGTKNSSGCGSGDDCFCCQDIDSSLIGDDDAVLAWIDSYIGDDDKRTKSGKKSKKSGH